MSAQDTHVQNLIDLVHAAGFLIPPERFELLLFRGFSAFSFLQAASISIVCRICSATVVVGPARLMKKAMSLC